MADSMTITVTNAQKTQLRRAVQSYIGTLNGMVKKLETEAQITAATEVKENIESLKDIETELL